MSTFSPAETLRKHRPLLLAMEAIGWFHMAGKARVEFLRKKGGEKTGYDEKKWHNLETPPFPWDTLLEWTKRLYGSNIPSQAWRGSFAEFTEKHADRNTGLLGLLQAAHGIVSGVEKNLPKNTVEYLNQTILHMWLSSPWGYPKRNLLADPPDILTPQGWQQLVREMRQILEEACRLGTANPPADVHAWRRWRKQAIGENSFIRRAFLSTLAETRLPNNDVTLWDQSYVAAALFKSAVAGALLNSQHPWGDKRIKQKTRWRLLTVAIGTEHYEARSVKIGDWTGAWGTIQTFFDQVAELVEVDLAVGSLLYRDDSVAVFSFPGERFDEDVPAGWLQGWEKWLQEQVDEVAEDLDLETPPHVRLSSPTRSLVPMVQESKKAREVVAVPVHKPWDVRWHTPSEAKGHVCPVCGVRLNGDPTRKSQPCKVCRERRHHRRDDWLQGRLGYDTIWFEEVADRNGRLALLTFSLDLEPWLSGERVDSLRAQAIPEWARFNPILSGTPNPIDPTKPFESLSGYIYSAVQKPFDPNDPLLKSLQEGYRHEKDWKTFFQKIVEDRAKAKSWDELNDDERAAWLAHQLFVKFPSPGRVYRFWRETEDFFRDLLREFRQIASRSENPWRVRRLVLVPKDKNNWKDLAVYNGRWRNAPLSLVYGESLGGFVTVSNLARLLAPEEQKEVFQDKQIPLEEEEDQSGRASRYVEVEKVHELRHPHSHLGVYSPVIPVNLSPLRFRVLVPLEVASECVDLAVARWKERFARVWDRLPLRVGVVAFPRTLPYQAVVEAARNIEEALEQREAFWEVADIEKQTGAVALYLRSGAQTLLRLVPVTMPDGREDVFYPYVEVEDRELRFPKDFRHPDGRVFRHVADLQVGDGIKAAPAGIVTLFMDSTAARFHVENVRLLDEWQRMRDTWRILVRVAPGQTALQRLRSELSRLESSWRTPQGNWEASENLRRDTYRALLVHYLDSPPENTLAFLTQAAVEGLLTWALDWHLSALKESKEG